MTSALRVIGNMSTAFLASPQRIAKAAVKAHLEQSGQAGRQNRLVFLTSGPDRDDLITSFNSEDVYDLASVLRDPDWFEGFSGVALILPHIHERSAGLSLSRLAALRVEQKLSTLTEKRSCRVAVWGAGFYGRMIMNQIVLPPNVTLDAVVDANLRLHGTRFMDVEVRGVATLDDHDLDLVIICIAGHRDSIGQSKKDFKRKHPFFCPFDPDKDQSQPFIQANHGSGKCYDLRDWSLWLTPDQGFMGKLQEKVVELWKDEVESEIAHLDKAFQDFKSSDGDPANRALDRLSNHSDRLSSRIQWKHPSLPKGLGKNLNVLTWQRQCLRDCGLSFSRQTVLDIGFGSSLLNALLMHVEGAKRVISIDPEADPDDCRNWVGYAQSLFTYLFGNDLSAGKKKDAFEVLSGLILGIDFRTQRVLLDPQRIDVRFCGLEDLDLDPGTVDLAFSNTVFEHVADCGKALQNLYRVMKPGAYAFHFIDYSPHGRNGDSHLSPCFNPKNDNSLNPYGVYLNRLKTPDFVSLFKDAGFHIEAYMAGLPATVAAPEIDRIHPDFKYLDTWALAEQSACFYLKKPA